MTAPRSSNLFTVALVGAAALKGKEVRDVLSERSFPAAEIKLLDEEDVLGQLEAINDEPSFIQGVTPEHLEGVDFTFLTASETYIRQVWPEVRASGSEVIDLSYALESTPGAVLRAPWLERELGRTPAVELQSVPVIVAHPAAVVMGLLMARLQKAAPVRLASAVVAHPASEYGRPGMDELHDQTVNLLSFQQMPSQVFGTQAAFNLFAQPIESAHPSLAEIETRILRHYNRAAEQQLPTPALLLLQAPVFHGCTIAMFVQMDKQVTAERLEAALTGAHFIVQGTDDDFPSNVNVAGISDALVSVRADSGGGNGFWIFAACDNLRVSAMQAVECAEEMVQTRPRGQLQ